MNEKLRRLLGGPETSWLVDRVRRRLELGHAPVGSVTLANASPEQRRAIERLLGRRPVRATSLSVSLEEVDAILRSSGACVDGLAAAVELLTGPVNDRTVEAAERSAAWQAAHAELDHLVSDRPELTAWRGWLDRSGLVRRLASDPADAHDLLAALARVLRRLPSPGVPIGRLAAETCGDAHALDDGRPVGTLALSAARALAGLTESASADARRQAWAAVDVHLDELSSTVLCLGLPGDAVTALGRLLQASAEVGEPTVLTLRQLRRHETGLPIDGLVRICENPVVIAAAADELGPRCPPLVCLNGRPSTAVWRLLELLQAGGARFAYHGDFDWGGVGIATAVYERIGWTPWRFGAADYLRTQGTAELTGRATPTPWDPSLSAEMLERNVRVEEELVLTDLLADLRSAR